MEREGGTVGEPRVDEALSALGELPQLPVDQHPVVFGRVHLRLQEVLGELDAVNDRGTQRS